MLLDNVENPHQKHRVCRRTFSAADLAEEVQRGSLLGEIIRKILR